MFNADLLIFDLDGTLADTKKDIGLAVNLTLKELGLPEKSDALIYSYVGAGIRRRRKKRNTYDQPWYPDPIFHA